MIKSTWEALFKDPLFKLPHVCFKAWMPQGYSGFVLMLKQSPTITPTKLYPSIPVVNFERRISTSRIGGILHPLGNLSIVKTVWLE